VYHEGAVTISKFHFGMGNKILTKLFYITASLVFQLARLN
jgi:hypothetical protein